jgi:hypothetical protein
MLSIVQKGMYLPPQNKERINQKLMKVVICSGWKGNKAGYLGMIITLSIIFNIVRKSR